MKWPKQYLVIAIVSTTHTVFYNAGIANLVTSETGSPITGFPFLSHFICCILGDLFMPHPSPGFEFA